MRCAYGPLNQLRIAVVGADGHCPSAGVTDRRADFVCVVGRAVTGLTVCDSGADAAGPACDESNSVLQFSVRRCRLSVPFIG